MHKELAKYSAAIFLAFCILSTIVVNTAKSEDSVTYQITDVRTELSDTLLNYTISGTSTPAYTVSERFSPFRVVIDIAGGVFSENMTQSKQQIPGNDFAALKISAVQDQNPAILRFEFSLADSHDYSVLRNGNDLYVKIAPASGKPVAGTLPVIQGRALTDFKVDTTPKSTKIVIVSNSTIEDYKINTVGSDTNRPPRMFLDIEAVAINELVREKHIGTSVKKIRVAPRGSGARIVFDSATNELFAYTVTPSPEGLVVMIDETGGDIPGQNQNPDATLDSLIGSSELSIAGGGPGEDSLSDPDKKINSLEADFSFSGYNKQRISVDFYKIDIHNVFRLFRQITDLNIIVDEGVSGSLTLALSDVPWDFALDIILNLTNLKKEERFNTLVIYPAAKEFDWPTRAEDNLSFEADITILEEAEAALIVEQTASQSKEIMLAKEFMAKARLLEQREEYEDAALLYGKAWEQWPANPKLANRLATLYLVNLGMNAKAVHYAKESLKIDPQNNHAALYAAIGSANMQRTSEAAEYFTQSVSDSPPMKEALISYASFSENNNQNEAALKLLNKYHSFYGETVDTMISKARILDKLGLKKDAKQQYTAILNSGFQLRPDLRNYIRSRIAIEGH